MIDYTNKIMVGTIFQLERQQSGKNTGQRIETMYVYAQTEPANKSSKILKFIYVHIKKYTKNKPF